jgi:hypothetical protein
MRKGDTLLVISLRTKDTIQFLKQMIQEKNGQHPDTQMLSIAGTGKLLLRDEFTIGDFG